MSFAENSRGLPVGRGGRGRGRGPAQPEVVIVEGLSSKATSTYTKHKQYNDTLQQKIKAASVASSLEETPGYLRSLPRSITGAMTDLEGLLKCSDTTHTIIDFRERVRILKNSLEDVRTLINHILRYNALEQFPASIEQRIRNATAVSTLEEQLEQLRAISDENDSAISNLAKFSIWLSITKTIPATFTQVEALQNRLLYLRSLINDLVEKLSERNEAEKRMKAHKSPQQYERDQLRISMLSQNILALTNNTRSQV